MIKLIRHFSTTGGESKKTLSQGVNLNIDYTYTLKYVYGVDTTDDQDGFCTATTNLGGIRASGGVVINTEIIFGGDNENPDTPTSLVEAFNFQPTADQELLAISFSCNNLATFDSAQFYLYELDLITETGCESNISIVPTTILSTTTTVTRPKEYPATVTNGEPRDRRRI